MHLHKQIIISDMLSHLIFTDCIHFEFILSCILDLTNHFKIIILLAFITTYNRSNKIFILQKNNLLTVKYGFSHKL